MGKTEVQKFQEYLQDLQQYKEEISYNKVMPGTQKSKFKLSEPLFNTNIVLYAFDYCSGTIQFDVGNVVSIYPNMIVNDYVFFQSGHYKNLDNYLNGIKYSVHEQHLFCLMNNTRICDLFKKNENNLCYVLAKFDAEPMLQSMRMFAKLRKYDCNIDTSIYQVLIPSIGVKCYLTNSMIQKEAIKSDDIDNADADEHVVVDDNDKHVCVVADVNVGNT